LMFRTSSSLKLLMMFKCEFLSGRWFSDKNDNFLSLISSFVAVYFLPQRAA